MDIRELERFPYFTGKILEAFYDVKHSSITLNRWLKSNKIKKIEKGKYTVHEDSKIYATTLFVPSYCSLRSALYYYQLTNQIPIKIQVMTKKRKKEVSNITFIHTTNMFGYKKEKVQGFDFFIADKEKLLLDCLSFQKEGVGLDELKNLLKEHLDKQKLIAYLNQINNLTLTKRAGYLLDKQNIDIYKEFEHQITNNKNYPTLYQLLPRTNKINEKWRLNINEENIV